MNSSAKIGWVLLLFLGVCNSLFAHSKKEISPKLKNQQFEFIENQGQWPASVQYKCPIPSGNLYLESNRLIYDFADYSPFARHHHGEEKSNSLPDKIKGHCFYINFKNGNASTKINGHDKFHHYYNYFLGNDSTKWASGVKSFSETKHLNLYPNIDLHSGTSNTHLKFEFEVKVGGNPDQILMEYEGVNSIRIKNQELVVTTSLGQIIEEKPYAYQVLGGVKIEVPCNYKLSGKELGFEFPNGYNKALPLIIDPTLIFSTYSGSTSVNFGYTATYDSKGYLYAGSTAFGASGRYPTTPGAYQVLFQGGFPAASGVDIAISKYDTNGTRFIYSTYLGGSFNEMPHSLVVNSHDELYVMGTTGSKNFPVHFNAPQKNMNNPNTANRHTMSGLGVIYQEGCDLFAFKFSDDGKRRLGGTYLGGSANDGLNDVDVLANMTLRYNYADEVRGEIDIDANDDIYIASCTRSADFPKIGSGFDHTFNGDQDGIIIKLNSDLDTIIWTSFLGGRFKDAIYSLAFNKTGDLYVTGGTNSLDTNQFPTGSLPGHELNFGGRAEGFITQIENNGSRVINSTFYGTRAYDQLYFVEIDKKGFVHVLGQTEDSTNYFIKNALYNKPREGVVISKLTPQLDSIIWSTTIGRGGRTSGISRPQLSPTAFLVDVCNSVYFSGWGGTTNNDTRITNNNSVIATGLDLTADAYQRISNGSDFYLCAIASDASSLTYGSYFGGQQSSEHVDGGTSRFDKKGIIYQSVCAGCQNNSDFPIKPTVGAVSSTNNASCNNAVFKMNFKPPAVIAQFQIPAKICLRDSTLLTNSSKEMQAPEYWWNFGNGDTSTLKTPKVFFSSPGTYTITLAITDTTSCNYSDTIQKSVKVVAPKAPQRIAGDTICLGDTTFLGIYLPLGLEYNWTPGVNLEDSTIMRPRAWPTKTTDYLLEVYGNVCTDTIYQFIQVDSFIKANIIPIDSICIPDTVKLTSNSTTTSSTNYVWRITNFGLDTAKSPELGITQKGIYQVELLLNDPKSCNKNDTAKTQILALSDTAYSLTPILSCNNESKVMGESNNPNYTYLWTPSSGLSDSTAMQPTNNSTSDGNYKLLVDRGVCVDTIDQAYRVDQIAITTPSDTDICKTGPTITLTANSTGLASTFVWSTNKAFSDTINTSLSDSTATVTPPDFANWYYAKAISSRGCEQIDSSVIRVNEFGIRADSSKSICLSDTVSLKVISLIPNDTLSALWQPYNAIIGKNDTTHILVNPSSDQLYLVNAENRIKCITKDSTWVRVSALDRTQGQVTASKDTILKNQVSQLAAYPQGFNYNWSPSYGLNSTTAQNPSAGPDTTTTYTVKVYDNQYPQCSLEKKITIAVEEVLCDEPWLFIPNSFSPNGDGENEVFYFRGRNVSQLELRVFNRWGELLFETTDQNIGWDGTFKNKAAQADVYVYDVKAVCVDGQVFKKKGDLTLIR